jgi:hypothetical protein
MDNFLIYRKLLRVLRDSAVEPEGWQLELSMPVDEFDNDHGPWSIVYGLSSMVYRLWSIVCSVVLSKQIHFIGEEIE